MPDQQQPRALRPDAGSPSLPIKLVCIDISQPYNLRPRIGLHTVNQTLHVYNIIRVIKPCRFRGQRTDVRLPGVSRTPAGPVLSCCSRTEPSEAASSGRACCAAHRHGLASAGFKNGKCLILCLIFRLIFRLINLKGIGYRV